MRPGKVLLFGLLGLVLAQLIAWWQQSASPLLAAVLTIAAGAIPLVIGYVKDTHPAPQPPPDRSRPEWSPRQAPPSRGTAAGLAVGVLVLLLVGGLAYGVSTAVALVTGREQGVPRLAAPVTGRAGALRVRVEQVEVGARFTQVRLTATNSADFPVTIPMFSNCQLVEPEQPALEARTGFGTSVIDVPPGAVPITKEVIFTGTPSAAATSLTLTCTTLYWQGFGQPGSLQVKKIALTG